MEPVQGFVHMAAGGLQAPRFSVGYQAHCGHAQSNCAKAVLAQHLLGLTVTLYSVARPILPTSSFVKTLTFLGHVVCPLY